MHLENRGSNPDSIEGKAHDAEQCISEALEDMFPVEIGGYIIRSALEVEERQGHEQRVYRVGGINCAAKSQIDQTASASRFSVCADTIEPTIEWLLRVTYHIGRVRKELFMLLKIFLLAAP